MKMERKNVGPISFSDFTGGLCNAYPAHAIANNQAYDALNVFFEKRGFTKHAAFTGIKNSLLFNAPLRGWFDFKKTDGSETFIAISDQKIYSVAQDGTLAILGTLTSDNECYAINYYGTLFLCNGADFVKIEADNSVTRVGIAAPAGFTASATGSGTLPAGVYKVYASYTRKVSGIDVLQSAPQLVSSGVTASGSNLIRVAVTASTDPQVTNITIWMSDAGGTELYYYGQGPNTTGNIDIASNSAKSTFRLMYVESAGNQLPPSLTNIWAANGRIMGCIANSNMVYYSLLAQNKYDLEKWSTEFNIPTIPYKVLSGHMINGDLYLNTIGGIYTFANADLSAKPQPVVQGSTMNTNLLYYPQEYLKTICEYNGALWGLTNDGFRIFDGTQFSIDLSKHIKPMIDKIRVGTSDINPSAVIYRRSGKRTEYQLSYCDTDVSEVINNRRLILNVDTITIVSNSDYRASWECASPGFAYALSDASNNLYVAQSSDASGMIAIEQGGADVYCLSDTGAFLDVPTSRKVRLLTKTMISELAGFDKWERIYALKQFSATCNINALIYDKKNYRASWTLASTGAPPNVIDGNNPLVIPFVLDSDSPVEDMLKFPMNATGNSITLEFIQDAIDSTFIVYEVELYGFHERNLFT